MLAMVVDDSAVIRKVARRIFEGLQFVASEMEDGGQALEQCSRQMPDLILVDWNMPVMDGLGFVRALRRLPGGSRPKVLFCTSENDPSHVTRAIHAGADDHILKPFDRHLLRAKIESVGMLKPAASERASASGEFAPA